VLPTWTRALDLFERFVTAAERLAGAAEERNHVLAAPVDETPETVVLEVNGHAPRER
jgi:hypothetical protein